MPSLAISRDRIYLYGAALVAVGLCALLIAARWQTDWIAFRTGGTLAGHPDLLDPRRYPVVSFVYPPGVAWLFVPAAMLPTTAGFYMNAVFMLGVCAIAGTIAARVYNLSIPFAALAVFAWVPATQAGFLGQFTPVALALTLLAILGLVRRNDFLAGVAIGLLLYKPTDAVPFVLLVLVRREWRVLAIVGGISLAWYVAGVAATAFDWNWPAHYLAMLRGYYAAEFARTALKTVSLPGLLVYAGASPATATLASLLLLLGAIPRFARSSMLAAASMAPLVGLASSVHAYMYEAVLVLPALFYAMTQTPEPWRTRFVVAAYVIAPMWVFGPWIRFDPLAIVVLGGAVLWIAGAFPAADPIRRPTLKGSAT